MKIKDEDSSNFDKGWATFKLLWKVIFIASDETSTKRDQKLMYVLYTRALAFHFLFSAYRLYAISLSKGEWFSDKIICTDLITEKCVIEYNESICDPLEPIVRNSLYILFAIGLILDFLCIKWRWLSIWFIYLEILTRILASTIPNQVSQDYTRIHYGYSIMLVFCAFYCLDGK